MCFWRIIEKDYVTYYSWQVLSVNSIGSNTLPIKDYDYSGFLILKKSYYVYGTIEYSVYFESAELIF